MWFLHAPAIPARYFALAALIVFVYTNSWNIVRVNRRKEHSSPSRNVRRLYLGTNRHSPALGHQAVVWLSIWYTVSPCLLSQVFLLTVLYPKKKIITRLFPI